MPALSRLLQASAILGLFTAVVWVTSFSLNTSVPLTGQGNNNSNCEFIWGFGQRCHCATGQTCSFDLSYRDGRIAQCDGGSRLVVEKAEIYIYENGGPGCIDGSAADCSQVCSNNVCNRQAECNFPGVCGDPFYGCEKGIRITVRCEPNTLPFPPNSCHFDPECATNADCGDDNVCTADQCIDGLCQNPDLVCEDDNNACTADSCDPIIGCKYVPKNCNDGNLCTTDSCDTQTGQCSNAMRSCDDNDPCTIDRCSTNEQCQHIARCPGPECPAQCQSSSRRPPDDDDPDGACDLIHNPTQCLCEAGAFEGCLEQINCNGNLFVCDDGNDCTQDTCNPVGGECEHVPWAVPIQGCNSSTGGNGGNNGSNGGDTGGSGSSNSNSRSRSSGSNSSRSRSSGSSTSGGSSNSSNGSSTSSNSSRSSSRSSLSSSESSRSSSRPTLSASSSSRSSSRVSQSLSSTSRSASSRSSSRSSVSRSSVSSSCSIPEGESLIAEWGFDAGSGLFAIDSSGLGNHGILMNGASWTAFASPSPNGGSFAISLDGQDDHVLVTPREDAAYPIPAGATSRTISVWVRPGMNGGPIVSMGNGDNSDQKFLLQLRPFNGKVILFEDGVNPENTIELEGDEIPNPFAGIWHHIMFTFDAGTNEWFYYLNGDLLKTGTFAVPIDTVANVIEIGSRHDSITAYFSGAIDDLRIYTEAFGEGEADALADACGSSRSSRFSSRFSESSSSRSSSESSVSSSRSSRSSSRPSSSRTSSSRSSSSSEGDRCLLCGGCGAGLSNFCDEGECLGIGLGFCTFEEGFFFNSCSPDPLKCQNSSQRSSARSSTAAAAGFCGDNIVQTSLGEDCDMGDQNVPPGTPGGTCSCTPGEEGCVSPTPGLIWFRGCQWPQCGDGEVNNLMLRSTEFVNFDLIREECDDGNFIDGDGCSALCVDELRPAPNSSRSSARSSTAPVCDQAACALGGNDFCAAQGNVCETTDDLPCVVCVAPNFSARSSSSRSSLRSSVRSSSNSSVASLAARPAECSACGTCGAGFANVCDEEECLDLGPCTFQGGIFTNSCLPGPLCPQIITASSVSSSRSSARSSTAAVAGFCGDNIVQTSLGEDCDMGDQNVPPGTPGGTCSCTPGEEGCVSPVPGLIWFRGCQWPLCGDGEINNLMLRSTEFVNFDLIREECDDGNFENGDGCSALCVDETKQFSSRSSARSSSSIQTATCSMTVCAEGGTEFCSVQSPGSICVRTSTLPCVQCVGLPVQSSVASSRISAASSASSRSSLSSSVISSSQSSSEAPFIARQHGKLSAIVFIDTDRDGKLDSNEGQRFNGATITIAGVTETGATFMRIGRTGSTGALIIPQLPFSRVERSGANSSKDDEFSRRGVPYYAALTASILAQADTEEGGYEIMLDVPPNYVATTPTNVTVPLTESEDEQVVRFGIAPAIVSSSAPALSSASSVRSSASSPASSAASLPVCGGNECLMGGDELCGAQNMRCSPINADPCIACLPYSSSPRSSAAPVASTPGILQAQSSAPATPVLVPAQCKGTECFLGGQEVCAARNLDCVHTDASPCIQCVGAPSTSRASRAPARPIGQMPVSPPPFSCSGNECAEAGDVICGAKNADCRASNRNPCFTCTARPTSRATSQASLPAQEIVATCAANECASGGDFFCSLQGFKCSPSNNFPCFTCEAAASSRATVAVRPAAIPPQSASRPSIPSIVPVPECICAAGQRCVDNVCLTPVQVTELPPFCGNARFDAGESCDEGSNNTDRPNGYCRRDCTFGRCGDRIVDTPLELCDDGNLINGDGCSSQCLPERPLTPEEVEARTLPTSIIELPLQQPQTQPVQQIVQIPTSQLPGSVVTPGSTPQPPATADTGPAAIAVMAAGAAAGYSWMRRKKK